MINNPAKHILIITERFHPEEFRINELALEWERMGYRVVVLTQFPSYPHGKLFSGYRNKLHQQEVWQGIEIHRVLSVMGYKDSLLKKFSNYIVHALMASIVGVSLGKKCDVVFVYHTGPLTNVIPAVMIKLLRRKEVIIWTTDIWPDAVFAYGFKKTQLREKLLHLFVKWIFSNCDHIMVSSRGFVKRLQEYVPVERIRYVPYWADEEIEKGTDDVSAASWRGDGKFHFTFGGNVGKVQNLENVIRAFSMVSPIRNKQLNIIGDGSDCQRLVEMVSNENIRNVVFWKRKPASEMGKYYAASDVLVISLKSDPLLELTVPGKFQSYLAAGKPIFAIMNGEVNEIVQNNKLGLAVSPDNLEEIKNGFESFAAAEWCTLDEYSRNCLSYCKREYDKNRIINEITDFLEF